MKNNYFIIQKLFFAGMFLWAFTAGDLSAQRTVIVEDGSFGNLNTVIEADTATDGSRVDSNTVYILKRDKVYILNGALSFKFPLNLEAENGIGERPRIIPGVSATGGESERPFRPKNDLHLKGLYITSKDIADKLNSKMIRVSGDELIINVENCYLEFDGQSFVRLDGDDCTVKFTDCTLANLGQTSDPSNGRIIDDRGNDVDTVVFDNCTIFNITHRVTRDDGGIMRYYRINNNTIFNVGGPVFQIGEVIKAEIYNNILANYSFYGNLIDPVTGISGHVFSIDSLGQDYIDQGFTQEVSIHHNNFYLDTAYTNLAVWGDSIAARVLFDETTQAFIDKNGEGATNISENLLFDNPPALETDMVTKFWELGPEDPGIPFFDLTNEPFTFNIPYSSLSYTAGVDGSKLGTSVWQGYTPVGIFSKESFENNIKIYPNPVTDVLNVTVQNKNSTIHIYNSISVEVKRFDNVDSSIRIPVSDMKTGLYFLTVEDQSGVQGKVKFIKK
jgi:hypothetical protein